jgi:hypothetical protein
VPDFLKQMPVRLQLGLATATLTLIACLILVWLSATSTRHITNEQAHIIIKTLSAQLSDQIARDVVGQDTLAITALLNRAVRADWIQGAELKNTRGDILAQAGTLMGVSATSSIVIDAKEVAKLTAYQPKQRVESLQSQQAWTLAGIACIIAFAFGALAAQMGRIYSSALEQLKVQIPRTARTNDSNNEIHAIRERLNALPLNLLAEHAGDETHPTEVHPAIISMVALDSLEHYIDTLNEESLERYTQKVYRCIQRAAMLYGGHIKVVRPLRVAMIFGQQPGRTSSTSAIQATLLLQLMCKRLSDRGPLNFKTRCALGKSEMAPMSEHDFYADLYVQPIFDQLNGAFEQDGTLWIESDLANEPTFQGGYTLGDTAGRFTLVTNVPRETKQLIEEQVEQNLPQLS